MLVFTGDSVVWKKISKCLHKIQHLKENGNMTTPEQHDRHR